MTDYEQQSVMRALCTGNCGYGADMTDYKRMNDHELVDMKNAIEREQKRREAGQKIPIYQLVSCMTKHMHFVNMRCALIALRDVIDLYTRKSIEDDGDYINQCAGIVGISFRVQEYNQEHFNARKAHNFFDDHSFQSRTGELDVITK